MAVVGALGVAAAPRLHRDGGAARLPGLPAQVDREVVPVRNIQRILFDIDRFGFQCVGTQNQRCRKASRAATHPSHACRHLRPVSDTERGRIAGAPHLADVDNKRRRLVQRAPLLLPASRLGGAKAALDRSDEIHRANLRAEEGDRTSLRWTERAS